MISGFIEEETRAEDTWYVPYTFYMLTSVRMWKGCCESYGFEVTFSAYPPDEFKGWPDLTHRFGFNVPGNMEEITLNSDITKLQTCVDKVGTGKVKSDFEGLYFTEVDGDYTELAPECAAR